MRDDIFFFKQKTAYEWRISDWSSDMCSSDLNAAVASSPKGRRGVIGTVISFPKLPAISIRLGGCGLNDLPLVASAFLLGAKSMPRDCDCRPSIGYSCIDGKMGAGRLARSSKKPAAPTVSATRTLRFLAGSRRLHSPSIPIRNEPDRWKGQDNAEYRGVSDHRPGRSEERRVGKEWVSTCRSWWSPVP